MTHTVNIYCDESCHLPHDRQPAMVLGALWCNADAAPQHNAWIGDLKRRHRLGRFFEAKWTKVSGAKVEFYHELLEYFFASPTMGFRAWVIPDKSILSHAEFTQTHDDWYYKMYFYLLRNLIWPETRYHVYLDVKDSRSSAKLRKLHEVLQNANYDFEREVIARMQHVHSHDVGLLQLTDLLVGAVSYHTRRLAGNPGKAALVELVRRRTGLSLDRNTLPSERKFNLCVWHPEGEGLGHV